MVESEEARPLGERGYVISTIWMRHWLLYAMRDGNPPGPVTNEVLLTPGGKISRRMKLRRDFRVVNGRVWAILLQRHGGGPEIVVDVPTGLNGAALSDVQSWLQQLDMRAALRVSPIQRVCVHHHAPGASGSSGDGGTGHGVENNDETDAGAARYCHTGILQLRPTQGLSALLDDLATRSYLFVLASVDGSMALSWYV